MLGMIVGSASIITVFGISEAATSGIAATFTSLGQSPVLVQVDAAQDYPEQAQIQYRDTALVAASLGPSAASVVPSWSRTFPISSGSIREYVSVVSDGAYHTDSLAMFQGRQILSEEVASGARVVVLTKDLSTKFFGTQTAVGDYLRINGSRFIVIGVFADIKGSFINSLGGSTTALVPYSTFHNDLDNGPPDSLLVYPTDPSNADAIARATIAALQHIHGVRAQYNSANLAEQVSIFGGVLTGVGAGLSAIGAVALGVAGIGIMNIMLISVNERTREIGIRKAIGATRGDITLQFLMEAVLLSLGGGSTGMVIGLLFTISAVTLLSKQIGEMTVPYALIVSISLTFSILVGTVFGSYPAIRAARMDPIEALRS
jgi:putative ABC transport system permease protein